MDSPGQLEPLVLLDLRDHWGLITVHLEQLELLAPPESPEISLNGELHEACI